MTETKPEIGGDVRNIRRFVAFWGIFFILVSQFLIFSNPEDDAVIFPPYTWLAVLGVVILVTSQLIRPTLFLQKLSTWFIFQERVFWVLAAILLSVLATGAALNFMLYTRLNYIPVITIWLLSAGAYVYAFFNISLDAKVVLKWIRKNRAEILSVAVVTLIAAAFRLYRLGEVPRVLDGDEGRIGFVAQTTVSGLLANPFTLWENFGAMYLQFIYLSMRFFGVNAFALRFVPAIGGILAMPSLYLLARWVGGQRIALITIIIFAFSHSHIHFSRILFGPTTTFFAVLIFYFLVRGLRTGQTPWFASAGVSMGLGLLIYDSSRVIPAVVLAVVGWLWLWRRPVFQGHLQNWGVFFLAALFAFGPMLGFAFQDFNSFVGRGNSVALWSPVVWEHETSSYGTTSVTDVIVEQVRHTFLTLHLYGDGSPHFMLPRPMVDPLTAALCALGASLCLLRLRSIQYFIPLVWVFLTFVLGGVITYDPPYWPHLNVALPAIVMMAGIAADRLIELLSPPVDQFGHLAFQYILVGLIILTGVFNWQAYYDYVKDNAGDRILAVRYLNSLPPGYQVYMMSQRLSWNEFAFRFFNEGVPGQDLTFEQLLADPPVVNGPAVFLVYDRPDMLQRLRELYRGGEIREHRNNEERVLFISYNVVPAGYTFAPAAQAFDPLSYPGWWLIGGGLILLLARAGFRLWQQRRRLIQASSG